jgi:hypothetical protein
MYGLSVKPGDLVRRNHRYKDHFRKDVAVVVKIIDDYYGTGPSAKVVWASDAVGDYHTWHPFELLEVINESYDESR